MVGMQFGILEGGYVSVVEECSSVDAEGVHDEAGHADLVADH